ARDLSLEGEDALNRAMTRAATRSDTEFLFREAAEKFQTATDLDPSRAESYAGLVQAYAYLGSWGFLTYEEAFPLMSAAAEEAMALDSLSAPVRAAMGYMSGLAEREYEQSLAHFLRAYELEPGHQNAPIWKNNAAAMLTDLGRPDEAMSLVRATAGFDSIGWDRETLVELLIYSDRYEEALTEAQHAIAQGADTARMNWRGSKALIELGRFDEARSMLEARTSATAQRRLAQLHARSGEPEFALRLVEDARAQSATDRMYSGRSDEAKVHAWLGDSDQALDLLEAEFAERGYIFYLPSDPAYRPLRQEPRFVRLLARTGLSCSFAEIGHTCRPM
ncbi:tetratricopeptide repeat protein, partial [Gemmatimonadota bacterium]